MAFCTNCGGTVNGSFCTQCGTPVSAAGSAPPPPPAPQPAAAPAPQAAPPYQAAPGYQPPPYQAVPPYQAAPPYQAVPPGARKTSPLIWILVVVLGLFLLGAIAVVGTTIFVAHKVHQVATNPGLAVTRMLAAMNPDLQVLNTDDGAGTITVRDKKTGKVTTMSFDDARNGRFHFTAQDENGKTATMPVNCRHGYLTIRARSRKSPSPQAAPTARAEPSASRPRIHRPR
jgi:nitrate reductase NapE component